MLRSAGSLVLFLFAAPAMQEPGLKIVSDVNLVLLDVAVTDSRGMPVSGLPREHFQVLDNGRPQQISSFSNEDLPVTVGFVIDTSGSLRTKRPIVVEAALRLLRESNPGDEMFVVTFNDRVAFGLPPATPFTFDPARLRDALLAEPNQGRTALHDGIEAALAHLAHGHRDRKSLILMSDGGDNASHTAEPDLIRLVESTPATIHSVAIYEPESKERNTGLLKRIAAITGGRFYAETENTHLEAVCRKIARDIRTRYTVGYRPPEVTAAETRRVEVKVSAPGYGPLRTRARRFYIANPASRSEP